MKKRKWWLTVCVLLCLAAVSACAQTSSYENAIYVYMCGSTLESHRGSATDNITEMLSANMPEDTCIVLQTGGARKWRDYNISNDHLTRFIITADGMREIEKLGPASMGDQATLNDFLTFCGENYPATHTGVIFWDHGSGSVDGICFDENHNMDALSIPEFADALSMATQNGQQKYDFIGFDACLMANYETAEAIHNYADYMIASEGMEPVSGWNYATLAERFGEDTFLQDMLDGYAQKCTAYDADVYTLSCIDLTRFGLMEAEFNNFSLRLAQKTDEELQEIALSVGRSIPFGYHSESEGYSNMFDLTMFAENMGHTALAESIGAITDCVNSPAKEGSGGLSVFYPIEDVQQVDRYIMNGSNEQYNRFLTENYSDIPTSGLIAFQDEGSSKNGEMSVSVTQDSMKYIRKVEYELFRVIQLDSGDKMALCLGTDTDIDIDAAEHEYTSSFGGKWVAWDGRFIHASAIERIGDITTFTTPVILNGEQGSVRFAYDIEHRSYAILGFLSENNDGATSRLHELQEGDEVTLIYEEISPEHEDIWSVGDTFIYDANSRLATKVVPDGKYLISICVWDIFGNVYRSNTELLTCQNGQTESLAILDDIWELRSENAEEQN